MHERGLFQQSASSGERRILACPRVWGTFCLLIAVVPVLLYYPALWTGLVADDFVLVGQLGFEEAARYFKDTFGFGRNEYRPATAITFAIDQWLWAGSPEGYHLTNIALHAITASLYFLTLYLLTGELAIAVVAALLFSIHPVNHSRVTWISARDASVACVLGLSAALLHIRWRFGSRKAWRLLAIGASCGAFLAYEGSVVLPAILLAGDWLFLSAGTGLARFRDSLRATLPFWIAAAGYLCLWQVMFSGELGAYDLALHPFSVVENYGRLLYTLFYGHRRAVWGVAYAMLFFLGIRAFSPKLRSIALLGAFVIVVAYVPFSVINGFASRFGYTSALGFALMMSTCLLAGWRIGGRQRVATICLGIMLAGYHMAEVRKLISEWKAAGEIAASIPAALRKIHPELPPGAMLLFKDVPVMHGRAMVYPTGLEAAVQRQYAVPIRVRTKPDEIDSPGDDTTYTFVYTGGEETLRQIR